MNERDFEHDSYLWDGTGTPDPELARLERTLGTLKHRGVPPALPARDLPAARRGIAFSRAWLAAAAALVLIPALGWLLLIGNGSGWNVRVLAGRPAIAGQEVAGESRLARGEWLVTDASSRARVSVGSIGSVEVEPNTRVRLVESRGREHRLALERGTIHAKIWAPPRFFFVDTPAGSAVDLGCAYTLHMDDNGAGVLRVSSGWVGFERDDRRTYVPEGAVCAIDRETGPGTPRYEDAPAGYAEALMTIDAEASDKRTRAAAYDLVLSRARRRDALSLWHLLTRGSPAERARVHDRLAEIAPPPRGVTREAVLAGDRNALDLWWDYLDIESSTWWRIIKKKRW